MSETRHAAIIALRSIVKAYGLRISLEALSVIAGEESDRFAPLGGQKRPEWRACLATALKLSDLAEELP